jgi:hypothetical protein
LRCPTLQKPPSVSATQKTPQEELAEKFHMSQVLLRRLNPHARFDRAGEQIVVANVEPMALHDSRDTVQAAPPRKQNRKNVSVATIVVEKTSRDVRAYGKDGKLLGFYPATIEQKHDRGPSRPLFGRYRCKKP